MVEEFEPDVFRQLIEYIHTGTVTLQPRTLLGEFTQLFLKVGNWPFAGLVASTLQCLILHFVHFHSWSQNCLVGKKL
jgi:hypothetical protein